MEPYKFKELAVWQRSMELTLEVYRLAKHLPAHERFGLATLMRRAAALVPTSIADGSGRNRGEYLRFLSQARASLMELDAGLELARRLNYLVDGDLTRANELVEQVRRMITAHVQTLSREIPLHQSLPTL